MVVCLLNEEQTDMGRQPVERREFIIKSKQEIITAFNSHNFHDDTVHAIRIVPTTSRRRRSRIEIELTQYVNDKQRCLTLTGCANVSFVADFDVLLHNAFANTEWGQADGSEERIRQIMTGQITDLNIEYEPASRHPTNRKMSDLTPYILFRIQFFGGTLEVVGRGFKLTDSRDRPSTSPPTESNLR